MRVLHPLLLFTLATSAAPAVVTEVVTEIAQATPEPIPAAQVPVQAPHDDEPAQKDPPVPPKPPPPPKEEKYFHEPGWDAESGHYDARYFRGKVPYEQHRPALRRLVRSYLTTFAALGVETWLAHGSLLGWWWNGRVMPWDYDLDVQVSAATLALLGDRYNQSSHEYEYEVEEGEVVVLETAMSESRSSSSDSNSIPSDSGGNGGQSSSSNTSNDGASSSSGDGGGAGAAAAAAVVAKIKKSYLLDVNPHHAALTKGNGANVIDARWIDTSNGMFIDITGLRERDPERSPGVWSCKNNHRYRTAELWPLRRTEFEGTEAWIPYAFDKVLTDEYGPKSLVTEEWAG
ncbi:LicD family-domain-containing protein [Hypoxylon argillaceum]|nr:LicD family-domain-containing protein [Hypoxylon argillaceum]